MKKQVYKLGKKFRKLSHNNWVVTYQTQEHSVQSRAFVLAKIKLLRLHITAYQDEIELLQRFLKPDQQAKYIWNKAK